MKCYPFVLFNDSNLVVHVDHGRLKPTDEALCVVVAEVRHHLCVGVHQLEQRKNCQYTWKCFHGPGANPFDKLGISSRSCRS